MKAGRHIKRCVAHRIPADRVLVVTEGTKTEPRYLSALLDRLGISSRRIVVKPSTGSDPVSIVDTAIKERSAAHKDKNPFELVWVVFDTERERAHLTEAINKAADNNIKLAVSAPSFEYWLLLHYEYTTSYMTCCDDVLKKLNAHAAYDKGTYDVSQLMDRVGTAIDNAQRVRADAKRTGAQYPKTDVDLLVVEIDGYADEELCLLKRGDKKGGRYPK